MSSMRQTVQKAFESNSKTTTTYLSGRKLTILGKFSTQKVPLETPTYKTVNSMLGARTQAKNVQGK